MIADESLGDVIAAYEDGTIVLDDGITTWNPRRAHAFLKGGTNAMIEKLNVTDTRPITVAAKINEIIEWVNGFIEANDLDMPEGSEEPDDVHSVVENGQFVDVNEAND
jgi:hypothetical protein